MTHASLFSGIGGFDLAARQMGWDNVFCCEKDEFCQRLLRYHFPESKLHDDVTTFKADKYLGRIDVLSGGFPCQPFSHAGNREGADDDRYLWPEMLRVIRECSPRWVVGENVRGILNLPSEGGTIGMVFEQVCADLEDSGYSVQSYLLPSAGVNAPHRRDRIFIVAYNHSTVLQRRDSNRATGGTAKPQVRTKSPDRSGDAEAFTANSDGNGLQRSNVSRSNTQQQESQESAEKRISTVRRRLRFTDFPTVSPVCGGDDGLPQRLDGLTFPAWRRESLKGYGNAVCVPLVMNIFEAIKNYDETI